MTTNTTDPAVTAAQRRWIAAHWLLGPRKGWTAEQTAQLRQCFPAVATLNEAEAEALREAHHALMRRRLHGLSVPETVAQIRVMAWWWGLGYEWMRLVRDTVDHVTGVDR
jgi:hypothetical protein